jgi:hypothetical protein
MSESQLLVQIKSEIERISKKLGLQHPSLLVKAKFMEFSKVTEWDLRKFGGYSTIINTYFPFPEKELKEVQLQKQRVAYLNKMEKKYGSWEAFQEQLTDSLVKQVEKIKIEPVVLNKEETRKYIKEHLVPSPSGDQAKRSLVTLWTDHHYGTNINKQEMGDLNEFNWVIGARRLGMLCEQIASYKIERRNLHEELVIMMAGDNIGGIIHNQEGPDYDLVTHQVNGTFYYFWQAINYLKPLFPKIRVLCQPGNHGRMQHKRSTNRAIAQKYDSFENIIFYSLSAVFAKDPQVEIITSMAPYIDAEIQGHRIWVSHGDTVFATGNVGKNIKLERIEQQIHRVNAEALGKGKKPFELFATGHVHHPVITQVGSGAHVVINGCLCGGDSYSLGVGIFSSTPAQVIWESTKKYVMGDNRQIFVAAADNNQHYEQIIKPFHYQLQAPKLI